MAKQTTVTLIDDIDGSQADGMVTFGIDGKTYEIDLSSANAETLRNALAPFIAAARKASGRHLHSVPTGSSARRPSANREQNDAIREWANRNGMKVAERGRIPASVLGAFHSRAQRPAEAPAPTPAPEAPAPAPAPVAAAEKPKAARKPRGNGKVEAPQAAPTGTITKVSPLTETMLSAVCEFAGELVVDHGKAWVELRGNRQDIAAKITAIQETMPGADMKQRAAKSALTRVVKELRNVRSRKVSENAA